MKIRNGFVSNSSSSSFIINISLNGNYKNVWDVAKIMIKDREIDYENGYFDEYLDDKYWENSGKIIERIEKLNLDLNTPMTMHTCNFETYIFERNGKIYVDTSNNTQWSINGNNKSIEYGEGLYCEGGDVEQDYSNIDFFHIDYGIYAREAESDMKIKNNIKCSHGLYSFKLKLKSGEIICPICHKDIVEKNLVKQEKIEIIFKNRLSEVE